MKPIAVRPITRAELGLFATLSEDPKRTEEVLTELWEECKSCPEWCFIAERNGIPIARVGFWVLPSIITTFHIGWLALPWHRDYLKTGRELLSQCLSRVRDYGVTDIEAALDSDDAHLTAQQRFFDQAGFRAIQQKNEYVFDFSAPVRPLSGRLTFRSLARSGTEAFLDAIRQVMTGTQDREDRIAVQEDGPELAAERYLGILKDIDYVPDRWFLAYLPGNKLAGLIAPQMLNDEVGAINYIGVVPEFRDQRLVDDLLTKGIATLQRAGANQVIASIDTENRPMQLAATRSGFRHSISNTIFRLTLSRPKSAQARPPIRA